VSCLKDFPAHRGLILSPAMVGMLIGSLEKGRIDDDTDDTSRVEQQSNLNVVLERLSTRSFACPAAAIPQAADIL